MPTVLKFNINCLKLGAFTLCMSYKQKETHPAPANSATPHHTSNSQPIIFMFVREAKARSHAALEPQFWGVVPRQIEVVPHFVQKRGETKWSPRDPLRADPPLGTPPQGSSIWLKLMRTVFRIIHASNSDVSEMLPFVTVMTDNS